MSEYKPTEYVVDFGDYRSNRFVMLNMTLIKQNGAKLQERIVRCRDCVYFDKYENDEISVCYRFDNEQPIVEPDGFCAWGERRERESAEVWNQWSADDVTCSEES